MTRDEIISAHPLIPFLAERGVILRGSGKERTGTRCAKAEHKAGHFCLSVDAERELWNCHDCGCGGSVIDWLAIEQGLSVAEVLRRFGGKEPAQAPKRPLDGNARNGDGKGKAVKLYDYRDEKGKMLFEVVRYEPKDFRQRAPDGKGGWKYSLDGVRRVLYNLPAVLAADLCWLAEGEKDADTLISLGFVATTNAMGAKKWHPDYTAQLRGKDVVILPDNDKAGEEHRELLLRELAPAVKSIRILPMPEGMKDVSDFAGTFIEESEAQAAILELAEKAEILYRGISVPVETMEELEAHYKRQSATASICQLELYHWLPALRVIRPLVPGEIVAILAGTGVGKTAILQNIAIHARVATLFIEVELPPELSFERFAAMATDTSGRQVEQSYRAGGSVPWRAGDRLAHIVSVHKPRVNPEYIHKIIDATELKTCFRPRLVLLDYVQLVGANGDSRYERTSAVMEEMKIVARETNTIIVIASQVGRGAKGDDGEITLASGKDSGSIENSAGLVLGAWRDADDNDRLWVRVLKNTKGKSGVTIPCHIKESLRIYEEAPTDD